jgi:Penicillin binding protein transpeptidase domain
LHDALVFGYDRAPASSWRSSFAGGWEPVRSSSSCAATTSLGSPWQRADDLARGRTLSIGERDVTVTLREAADFLRTAPVRTLDAELRAAVVRGTAASVAAGLDGTGWRLGGKTGTGTNVVGPTSDGWFAGVIFEGDVPRYTFAVFVEHHGPGGGHRGIDRRRFRSQPRAPGVAAKSVGVSAGSPGSRAPLDA